MDATALAQFERTCEAAMGSGSVEPAARALAGQQLAALGQSLDHIGTIQSVLDNSMSDLAVTAASQSLLRLVTEQWNAFSPNQRVEIRNYLLTKLASKGPQLATFSVMSLVQLVCRLTKFAWLDEGNAAIREIVKETEKFLQATFQHCVIGLRLLNELVGEMNYKNKNRSLTQHRKVAVSFRDLALFDVFEISLSMLNQLATRAFPIAAKLPPAEAAKVEDQLLEQSLSLLDKCLNFDFIGVLPDESTDDAATLQVPNAWKERIQTGSTLRLLFNVYKGCTTGKIPLFVDASAPPIVGAGGAAGTGGAAAGGSAAGSGGAAGAATVFGVVAASSAAGGGAQPMRDFPLSPLRAAQTLDCISLMISVRRSLFSTDMERKRFLTHIMRGVCEVLREKQGLTDAECYHRFCRLLSRIKNNQQLNELIRAEGYAEWLHLTATFTIDACQNPGWSSNSMHYILGLWARLVASVPYARLEAAGGGGGAGGASGPAPDVLLDRYVPSIVGAYVRGRVDQLMGADQETALDELADLDNVEDQLENLPVLCRFLYEEAATMVKSVMDPLVQNYGRALAAVRANAQQNAANLRSEHMLALRVIECQLAWMVAIIGAIIGGGGAHASSSPTALALMRSSGMASASAMQGEEVYDAELCRLVLQLMVNGNSAVGEVANRLPSAFVASQDPIMRVVRVDARLDTAFLYFMDQFRKAWITDASGMPTPQAPKGEAAWSQAAGSGRAGSDASSSSMALLRPLGSGAASATNGGGGMGSSTGGSIAAAASGGGLATMGSMFDGPPGLLAMIMGAGGGPGGIAGFGGGRVPTSYAELLESATGRQRIFLVMFERMGLGDHTQIVTHMVLKLANNLRFWGENDVIIRRSNDVLRDLVFSYASGRLLLSIDAVTHMLLQHGPQNFPFLTSPHNVRHRTSFYTSLARLVFFEDESERFEPFITPLLVVLTDLAPSVHLRDERVAAVLIGSARDLRGVLAAAHNRSAYLQCFDALHPAHLETLARSLEVWYDQPTVTTSVLKFFAELALQRGQRIQFGNSSPNGILLFRRASQAICAYGTRTLASPAPPPAEAYARRYKGVMICAQLLGRCMEGGFVNFGVLEHYQDRSFADALDVLLQLLLSVSPQELLAFPKLAVQFMTVMHYACRGHLEAVAKLPPPVFLQAVRSISEGLDSLDADITTQAAFALDQLASHFVRLAKKEIPLAVQLRAQIAANSGVFQTLMNILFTILVFSEQANHYTLARPMLPVILAAEAVQPDVLNQLLNKLVSDQPREHQERMRLEFDGLTKDITRSLDVLNRDRFLQRLSAFRVAVREFAIV